MFPVFYTRAAGLRGGCNLVFYFLAAGLLGGCNLVFGLGLQDSFEAAFVPDLGLQGSWEAAFVPGFSFSVPTKKMTPTSKLLGKEVLHCEMAFLVVFLYQAIRVVVSLGASSFLLRLFLLFTRKRGPLVFFLLTRKKGTYNQFFTFWRFLSCHSAASIFHLNCLPLQLLVLLDLCRYLVSSIPEDHEVVPK